MSSRRSKVIGSVKHLEYFEGRRGVPKGKIVFPAPTCSSPNNSRPASPEKGYQAFLDRTEHLSMPSDAAGDITFRLKNGEGYMVERQRYAKHLETAKETKEVSSGS